MAEERNIGLARVTDPLNGEDATKEELQRRMEEARESITLTVNEIKETVTNQYQQVRETISDSLDWREQFRRRPIEFSVGALSVGLVLGYTVGGALKGDGRDEIYDDEQEESEDIRASVSASHLAGDLLPQRSSSVPASSTNAYGATAYERSPFAGEYQAASAPPSAYPSAAATAGGDGTDARPSYSSGYDASLASTGNTEQALRPSLIQRVKESGMIDKFKETKAYDRLQEELSSLGDRFVEELSSTARNVVLPALLGKVKDMIGIDLSAQREVAQRTRLEQQTNTANADAKAAGEGDPMPSAQSVGQRV